MVLQGLAGVSVVAIAGMVVVLDRNTMNAAGSLICPACGGGSDQRASPLGQATCCLMRSSWERQWGWMRMALTWEVETMRMESRQASTRLQ